MASAFERYILPGIIESISNRASELSKLQLCGAQTCTALNTQNAAFENCLLQANNDESVSCLKDGGCKCTLVAITANCIKSVNIYHNSNFRTAYVVASIWIVRL
jgi:hypothetical protein